MVDVVRDRLLGDQGHDLEDLGADEAGGAFAAAQVAALTDAELRSEAEAALDRATRPWRAQLPVRVVHLLRAEGPDRNWTADERRALDEVLALRGLR